MQYIQGTKKLIVGNVCISVQGFHIGPGHRTHSWAAETYFSPNPHVIIVTITTRYIRVNYTHCCGFPECKESEELEAIFLGDAQLPKSMSRFPRYEFSTKCNSLASQLNGIVHNQNASILFFFQDDSAPLHI